MSLTALAVLPSTSTAEPAVDECAQVADLELQAICYCTLKATGPLTLRAPAYCGPGRWLPEAVYLSIYQLALEGEACPGKIERAEIRATAALKPRLTAAEENAALWRGRAEKLSLEANPPALLRFLRVGAGGLAGAGVGVVGGATAAGLTDLGWTEGLGGGAALGFLAGIVSGLIVELLF